MRAGLIPGAVGILTLAVLALQPDAHATSDPGLNPADAGSPIPTDGGETRATAGTLDDLKATILERYQDLLVSDPVRFCDFPDVPWKGTMCRSSLIPWVELSELADFSVETSGDPTFLDDPLVVEATPERLTVSDLINPNGGPMLMTSVEKNLTYVDSSTTTTTHGFGLGGAVDGRLEIPLSEDEGGGLGGSLQIKYDFSTSTAQTHSVSESVTAPRQNVLVPAHTTAHVWVVLSRVRVSGLIGQDLHVHAVANAAKYEAVRARPMESAEVMSPWPYTSRDGEPMSPSPEGWHPMIQPDDSWTLIDNIARFDGFVGDGMQLMINCTDNATGETVDCNPPETNGGPLRLNRFITEPGTSAEQSFITPVDSSRAPEDNLPRTAFAGAQMRLKATGGTAPYRYQVTGPATVTNDVVTITGPGKVDVEMTDADGTVTHYPFHPTFFEQPQHVPMPWTDADQVCQQTRPGSVVPPRYLIQSSLQVRHSGALVNEWGDPERNNSAWFLLDTTSRGYPYAATSSENTEDDTGGHLAAPLTLRTGYAPPVSDQTPLNLICMTPAT